MRSPGILRRYPPALFADSFETGDLSDWSSAVSDNDDLSVSAQAALVGNGHGLQAVIDGTAALYVQDETPAAAGRYYASRGDTRGRPLL